MRIRSLFATTAAVLALCSPTRSAAADKAEKQAELRKAADATLQKFYKAKPGLQAEVKAAPGHAVFTTFGLTFLIGGAGGGGVAQDKAGHVTYMSMAQASAGPKVGIGSNETLIVFKTAKAYQNFVDKGWDFGGSGAASAGAGGKKAGAGEGEQLTLDAKTYTYSKNGVELGGVVAGTKFWKDKDLN